MVIGDVVQCIPEPAGVTCPSLKHSLCPIPQSLCSEPVSECRGLSLNESASCGRSLNSKIIWQVTKSCTSNPFGTHNSVGTCKPPPSRGEPTRPQPAGSAREPHGHVQQHGSSDKVSQHAGNDSADEPFKGFSLSSYDSQQLAPWDGRQGSWPGCTRAPNPRSGRCSSRAARSLSNRS